MPEDTFYSFAKSLKNQRDGCGQNIAVPDYILPWLMAGSTINALCEQY